MLRISLCGGLVVEADGRRLPGSSFPGRQGRVAFALLVMERGRSVPRQELAEALWPQTLPASWSASLNAIVSKIRRMLTDGGLDGASALPSAFGCYRLHLPEDAWVDIEAARQAGASLAREIASRTFMAGDDCPWVDEQRARMRDVLVQALLALAEERLQHDPAAAVEPAAESVSIEPFREAGWRLLMRAHAGAGDRGEALRAYERCRRILADELGADPSAETEAIHLGILRQQDPPDAGSAAVVPAALTRFVGRAAELDEIGGLLERHRLVTLTGLGGSGKTRLAGQLASRTGCLAFVELAALVDGTAVPGEVARALCVDESKGRTLADHVRTLTGLVVVDNCEHVLRDAAGTVRELLLSAPGITVLATSRVPLGVQGEAVWAVPPMDPDEAVTLFAERAEEASASHVRSDDAVRVLCERLGRLPLGLELAAARTSVLTVEQIAERLAGALVVLHGSGGPLQAAVEWSIGELDPGERSLFSGLTVFAGGFDIDAAEAVCGNGVLPAIARLVSLSLLTAAPDGDRMRYGMLEPVRQLASDALAAEDLAACRRRHLSHFLSRAEQAAADLTGASFVRLDRELDNLRSAFTHALEHARPDELLRLATATGRFCELRGSLSEGRQMLASALDAAGTGAGPALRTSALHRSGILARRHGDNRSGDALLHAALEIRRTLDDPRAVADSLQSLGGFASDDGDVRSARDRFTECLRIRRRTGDRRGEASALSGLAGLEPPAVARTMYEESLAIRREVQDGIGIAADLRNLCAKLIDLGELEASRLAGEEALAIATELGSKELTASICANLGVQAERAGDADRARSFYERALTLRRETGAEGLAARSLYNLGVMAVNRGDQAEARRLLEEALVWFRRMGDRRSEAFALLSLGEASEGEYAAFLHREALTALRDIGDQRGQAFALAAVAEDARVKGSLAEAAVRLAEAVELAAVADPASLHHFVTCIASWAAHAELDADAIRLLGVVERLRDRSGMRLGPADAAAHGRFAADLRTKVGPAAFDDSWTSGWNVPGDRVVEEALSVVRRTEVR